MGPTVLFLVAMMGLFGLLLLLLAAYGLFWILISAVSWALGSRHRAFRRLANHYGGRCEARGTSSAPIVSFSHDGDLIRVGLAPPGPGGSTKPATRIIVRFGQPIPLRLELAPIERGLPRRTLTGTSRVRLGDRGFDGGFVVHANDVDMARDALSPSARRAIQGLRRLVPPGGLQVTVSPERLLTQLDRGLSENTDVLFEAVAETLRLREALLAGVAHRLAEGVTLLDASDGDAHALGPSICKVCDEPITDADPVAICERCGVPHHLDCWEYVDGCSIYGCGGKLAKTRASR